MKSLDFHNGVGALRLAFLVLAAVSFSAPSARADRIILRSLDVITDRTVAAFDEDGIQLDNNMQLGWHEIESAKIAADKQAAFNTLLNELGAPLYRIGQRLNVGDYRGALEPAVVVYARYRARTSDTAYMVCQARMWGHLARGEPEHAVEPYLRCYTILRARRTTRIKLPGTRRLQFDAKTGLAKLLPPVWFDQAAAKAVMPEVRAAIGAMKQRPPAAYLYFATLALAAGETEQAKGVMRAVKSREPAVKELQEIIAAQAEVVDGKAAQAVAALAARVERLGDANKPLAIYWLGRSKLLAASPEERQAGMLLLLRIPAVHGRSHSELAGAALAETMQALEAIKDIRGSVAVRGELLAEYGQTAAARRMNTSTTAETDN